MQWNMTYIEMGTELVCYNPLNYLGNNWEYTYGPVICHISRVSSLEYRLMDKLTRCVMGVHKALALHLKREESSSLQEHPEPKSL